MTGKVCNNSAYFIYIIGHNKINYNLQKKSIIENFIGGPWPPLPPASPGPGLHITELPMFSLKAKFL